MLATRVKSAHKLRGQKLIVSDLRENEIGSPRRTSSCIPKPGTDLVWLSAITRYLLDSLISRTKTSLRQWVNGLDEYKKLALAPFTMGICFQDFGPSGGNAGESRAHDCGSKQGVCILWAMGVTQQSQGSDTSTAISNLLLVSGNYMRTGTVRMTPACAGLQQRAGCWR